MQRANERLARAVSDEITGDDQAYTDLDQAVGYAIDQLTSGAPTVAGVLDRTVELVCRLLPHADGASITVFDESLTPRTTASTADWVRELDEIQYQTKQGPCLEVATTSAPAAGSNDLAASTAWPVFGPRAHELGVNALIAAGLSGRPDHEDPQSPAGALNVYSRDAKGFTGVDRGQILWIASIAGVAVRLARIQEHNDNLTEALSSRDVIGQAKGILMERHALDENQAFALLRQSSNRLNRKLRDLAADVVAGPRKNNR